MVVASVMLFLMCHVFLRARVITLLWTCGCEKCCNESGTAKRNEAKRNEAKRNEAKRS